MIMIVSFWFFFDDSSDMVGNVSPVILGIAKAVFIVVPSMSMAATPVGASSKTVRFSGFISPYLSVLTTL